MSNEIITYLIGAGASANMLPTVKDYCTELADCSSWMFDSSEITDADAFNNTYGIVQTPLQIQSQFSEDIDWICAESEKRASVDTFAKFLYLHNRQEDLNRLKATLACFFMLQQDVKGTYEKEMDFDMRYDTFWANVLDRETEGIKLPDNIRILTWNYDYQFEKSFLSFDTRTDDVVDIFKNLQVWPDLDFDKDKFCILHLNGLAGLHIAGERLDHYIRQMIKQRFTSQKERIIYILAAYAQYRFHVNGVNISPTFNFAWENNAISVEIMRKAIETVKDSKTLVVIGYSFPFFNRKVDKKIIGAMAGLNKVYVQSKDAEDAKNVISRFYSYSGLRNIEPITDPRQFYIPYEYGL